MAFGLVVRVDFLDAETEEKFKAWAKLGNARSTIQGVATLGLKAHLSKLEGRSYIFYWEHIIFYSFSWFMRFMLWVVKFRIRKGIRVSSVSKAELIEIMLKREGYVV